jgi:hypothetical protein
MNNKFIKYWIVQFPFCKLRLYIVMSWNMTEPRNMICSICRNHSPVLSSLMTFQLDMQHEYHDWINMWRRKYLPFLQHLSSPRLLMRFCIDGPLIFCVMFCSRCSSFCHCVVCPLIYCLWLPLCYLQTFLKLHKKKRSASIWAYSLFKYDLFFVLSMNWI